MRGILGWIFGILLCLSTVMAFLTTVTDGQKQSTKKLKFSLLRSFFNFIKDSFDSNLPNPCDTPLLRKTFKTAKGRSWTILDRDVVDEIIVQNKSFEKSPTT